MRRKSHFWAYVQRNLLNACRKKNSFEKKTWTRMKTRVLYSRNLLSAGLTAFETIKRKRSNGTQFYPTLICPSKLIWQSQVLQLQIAEGHYATSRKVAGSSPDCVITIFYWYNPSGRIMALGSTQPLTEMRTMNIPWGVKAASVYG